jgi:hypothetical protein
VLGFSWIVDKIMRKVSNKLVVKVEIVETVTIEPQIQGSVMYLISSLFDSIVHAMILLEHA